MEAAVERAARTIGYENAGTFEFLLGPDGRFFFIELNCRLQVEHPVSELVTGVDIVREQLRIAAGEQLLVTGRADRRGHAIEIRVNAEDPSRGFAPAPGLLTRFRPPLGAGVRVDTFVEEGMTISPYYDSLLAKVCVWAETREAAIARGIRALGELELEGVPTTRELALDILRSDAFTSGDYSTGYLAEMQDRAAVARTGVSRDGFVLDGRLGRIELPGATLAALVATAAEQVEGARVRRPRRGLDVSVEDGTARIELELAAPYGAVLPELARSVQTSVAAAVTQATGLEVAAVDVSIEELDG